MCGIGDCVGKVYTLVDIEHYGKLRVCIKHYHEARANDRAFITYEEYEAFVNKQLC